MGQHDVELIDPVEQRRLLDQSPDPGARVDQNPARASPEQSARRLATVGRGTSLLRRGSSVCRPSEGP